jgi:hypothetical protein
VLDESLVGKRVMVYWPYDDKWYCALVEVRRGGGSFNLMGGGWRVGGQGLKGQVAAPFPVTHTHPAPCSLPAEVPCAHPPAHNPV